MLFAIYPHLDDLLAALTPRLIAIDMPIGLPTKHIPGGRQCEVEARKILGPRRNSVFPTVPRDVVEMCDVGYAATAVAMKSRYGVSLSQQSFAILPRIREVDLVARREGQARIIEVHPEVCFLHLNGGQPLPFAKKTAEGQRCRHDLLERFFGPLRFGTMRGAAMDDYLDALAALWTAQRVGDGQPARLPTGQVPVDGHGLRMEMWA